MLYLPFADWIWPEFYLKNHPLPHGKHTPYQLWQLVLYVEIFIICLRHFAKCINKFHEDIKYLNIAPDGA